MLLFKPGKIYRCTEYGKQYAPFIYVWGYRAIKPNGTSNHYVKTFIIIPGKKMMVETWSYWSHDRIHNIKELEYNDI